MPFVHLLGNQGEEQIRWIAGCCTLAEANKSVAAHSVDAATALIKNQWQLYHVFVEVCSRRQIFSEEKGDLLVDGWSFLVFPGQLHQLYDSVFYLIL